MLRPRKQHDTDGAPHRPHSDYNYMLLILTTGRAFWAYLGKGCAAGRDFGTLSFVCVRLRSEFGTCTMPMRTAQMHIRSAIRMEHKHTETLARVAPRLTLTRRTRIRALIELAGAPSRRFATCDVHVHSNAQTRTRGSECTLIRTKTRTYVTAEPPMDPAYWRLLPDSPICATN